MYVSYTNTNQKVRSASSGHVRCQLQEYWKLLLNAAKEQQTFKARQLKWPSGRGKVGLCTYVTWGQTCTDQGISCCDTCYFPVCINTVLHSVICDTVFDEANAVSQITEWRTLLMQLGKNLCHSKEYLCTDTGVLHSLISGKVFERQSQPAVVKEIAMTVTRELCPELFIESLSSEFHPFLCSDARVHVWYICTCKKRSKGISNSLPRTGRHRLLCMHIKTMHLRLLLFSFNKDM